MCLRKTHWLPKRAKEDIIVYKELVNMHHMNEWLTPYMYAEVVPGKTILVSERHPFCGIFSSEITDEGIHAYLNPFDVNYINEIEFFKAIIPKGSWYYVGENNDIASSELLITDEIIA